MFGWRLIRVDGESMAPDLPSGSYALFRKCRSNRKGDTVLVNHSRLGLIIKDISDFTPGGQIWLKGRSPLSISRQRMGQIDRTQILGKLIWAHRPRPTAMT